MTYRTINKQFLLSIFLFFIALTVFGQRNKDSLSTADVLKEVNLLSDQKQPSLHNNSVKIVKFPSLYDNRPNYIYNNSKDTIRLSSIDSSSGYCFCDPPKVVSEIQIDKKGAKEIIFHRRCAINNLFYASSFPQKSTTIVKKYEIWNLDTKQLLFEAKNYFKSHYKNETIGFSKKRCERGRRYYQYRFKINKEGNIQIRFLRGKEQAFADNKKGSYIFINGKYALKK